MKGGKVFISHAAADRQLADAFVRFLRPGAIFAGRDPLHVAGRDERCVGRGLRWGDPA
jgi:hypothetical protein